MTIKHCNPPLKVTLPRFNYTWNGRLKSLHKIGTSGGTVEVVGDPGNASYEWIIRDESGAITKHSDDGYGCVGVAMRDGLIIAEGFYASGDELLKPFIDAAWGSPNWQIENGKAELPLHS